tara:strand:- start:5895 stop:6416 length:522 start_codon:yes stop_codon:yes gene_type:complete
VHVRETKVKSTLARPVYIRLVPHAIWIFGSRKRTTRRRHVSAHWVRGDGGVVVFLADGLDAVGVVARVLGVVNHLGVDVDAGIDEADGVDVDGDIGQGKRAVGEKVILCLEVVGEDGAVVAVVGLAPDAEAVGLGLEEGGSGEVLVDWGMFQEGDVLLHPCLHELPHDWCSCH